jgi:hypothetical protein
MVISLLVDESSVASASSGEIVMASPIPKRIENGTAAFLRKRDAVDLVAFELSDYLHTTSAYKSYRPSCAGATGPRLAMVIRPAGQKKSGATASFP